MGTHARCRRTSGRKRPNSPSIIFSLLAHFVLNSKVLHQALVSSTLLSPCFGLFLSTTLCNVVVVYTAQDWNSPMPPSLPLRFCASGKGLSDAGAFPATYLAYFSAASIFALFSADVMKVATHQRRPDEKRAAGNAALVGTCRHSSALIIYAAAAVAYERLRSCLIFFVQNQPSLCSIRFSFFFVLVFVRRRKKKNPKLIYHKCPVFELRDGNYK